MYTNVKRTAETAQIIAVNKGENVSSNINDWHKHSIENLTEINQNLKESWYVKPNQSASNCKGNAGVLTPKSPIKNTTTTTTVKTAKTHSIPLTQ